MADEEYEGPVLLDHASLAPDTLRSLVEDFVTRDGTDYGATEAPLERRVADVLAQLKSGKATISFDPDAGTTTIVLSASGRGQHRDEVS
jgi:uncharacterized protein YheU (UPF0270 family)